MTSPEPPPTTSSLESELSIEDLFHQKRNEDSISKLFSAIYAPVGKRKENASEARQIDWKIRFRAEKRVNGAPDKPRIFLKAENLWPLWGENRKSSKKNASEARQQKKRNGIYWVFELKYCFFSGKKTRQRCAR